MTPQEVENAARRQYNATGDTFFSSEELAQLQYFAQCELARETLCIEQIYSASTVSGTQTYTYPTQAISIKRITLDGKKLKKINMREDDLLTLANQVTTQTGEPEYYFIFDKIIYLRPVPNAVYTLRVFSQELPAAMTSSTTSLSVPLEYHPMLVDYLVGNMALKDGQGDVARYHFERWNKHLLDAKRFVEKRERRDDFSQVIDEEVNINTILGVL